MSTNTYAWTRANALVERLVVLRAVTVAVVSLYYEYLWQTRKPSFVGVYVCYVLYAMYHVRECLKEAHVYYILIYTLQKTLTK